MEGIRVAVVGDILLDQSRLGQSTRVSPEDPTCPILNEPVIQYGLGGAGNLANWLAHEPETMVQLLGLVVGDEAGSRVRQLCWRNMEAVFPGFVTTQNRRTSVKERTYLLDGEGQLLRQLVRCDWDSEIVLDDYGRGRILEELGEADLIVVADYGKGVFEGEHGESLIRSIGTQCRQAITVVNSKTPARWQDYRLDALICNQKEADSAWVGPYLEKVKADYLIITRSEKGVSCFPRTWRPDALCGFTVPSPVGRLVDPTGAGDAFAAGFALQLYHKLKKQREIGRDRELSSLYLERILHIGQAWAACCCSQIGCGDPSKLTERGGCRGNAERVEVAGRV